MAAADIRFQLPTVKEKEDYTINEVSSLFGVFSTEAIRMTHMDTLNVTFKFEAPDNIADQLEQLPDMGYELTDSKICQLYHKFDDTTAVASNVSFDKSRQSVIISVNM